MYGMIIMSWTWAEGQRLALLILSISSREGKGFIQEPRQPLVLAVRGWRMGGGLMNAIFDGAMLMDSIQLTSTSRYLNLECQPQRRFITG